jgi:pilus assembly protein Flp/PilA
VKSFIADTGGATAIEYALIAGLISVFIVGALANLRTNLVSMFVSIANAMP